MPDDREAVWLPAADMKDAEAADTMAAAVAGMTTVDAEVDQRIVVEAHD